MRESGHHPRRFCVSSAALVCLGIATHCPTHAQQLSPSKGENVIRVATYNVSLNRSSPGSLTRDLKNDHPQAKAVAAVIRTVQPDILLLNELDFDSKVNNAQLFEQNFLCAEMPDQLGSAPWPMKHIFIAPVNTGIASGMDLNRNQQIDDPEDAWGYGRFPGQYGMAVLSRFEIQHDDVRSMQEFSWSKLPAAMRPMLSTKESYYADDTWARLRLSSKSFWDVPIATPHGQLHMLASHPTPPAFDGPEDRNGCRNHDEIKLIQYYIESAAFLKDDAGKTGGLARDAAFVVVGDLNSDPNDGGSLTQAIVDLIEHPRIAQSNAPKSDGARVATVSQGQMNLQHKGNPAEDTSDFGDTSVGNLRVDYVLPSTQFEVVASGVFWPTPDSVHSELRPLLKQCMSASDHHLVWVDIRFQH